MGKDANHWFRSNVDHQTGKFVCICAFLEDWCGYVQIAAQSAKNIDTMTLSSNDFTEDN